MYSSLLPTFCAGTSLSEEHRSLGGGTFFTYITFLLFSSILHFGHQMTMLCLVISEHICNLESRLSSEWLQPQPSPWILSKTTLFNIFNFNLDRSPGVRSLTGKFQCFFYLSSSASVKWLTSKFSRLFWRLLSVWPHLAKDTALAVYWIYPNLQGPQCMNVLKQIIKLYNLILPNVWTLFHLSVPAEAETPRTLLNSWHNPPKQTDSIYNTIVFERIRRWINIFMVFNDSEISKS